MNEIDRLAWTLIHFVWQGAGIAALYDIARYGLARRAGPNARYLLALSALALMSLAPLLTWIVLGTASSAPAVHSDGFTAALAPAPLIATAALPAPAATQPELLPPSLLPWIAALWCAGALFFWMRLTLGWLLAARLRTTLVNPAPGEWQTKFARLQTRLQVSRPVRLLISARVAAPAVVGWLRPVVLAPACAFTGLSTDQLEAVLLHKLAHIRRHDYLVNLWQSTVEALLFYHPAVWWVSGHMRAEREFCCDDLAVAASGDALGYARALAGMEAARPRQPDLAVAANGGALLRRIARLLEPARSGSPAGPGVAAPLLLAGAILLCLAGFHGWGQAAPALRFDAASVKPVGETSGTHIHESADPGHMVLTTTMHFMVLRAYGINARQLGNEPDWFKHTMYTINATTSAAAAEEQQLSMLRTLLADRFQLKLREEDRDTPILALEIAPGGPKFKPLKPGADTQDRPEPPGVFGLGFSSVTELVEILNGVNGGRLLAAQQVVDRTHLSGDYDIYLETAMETQPSAGGNLYQFPDLARDLESELGLKLVPDHARLPYFVVEHAAMPGPD